MYIYIYMNTQHSTVRCITIYTRTNNSSKGRFGMHEYTSEGRKEQMNRWNNTANMLWTTMPSGNDPLPFRPEICALLA